MNSVSVSEFVRGRACAAVLILVLAGCSGSATDVEEDEPPADRTPPAAVTDLRVVDPSPATLTLRWTAPGDDGVEGYAFAYDLRGSLDPITPGNFEACVVIDLEDPPLPPGVTEEVLVDGLEEGGTYHFALKTRDEAGNVSGLSNDAHGTCLFEETVTIPDEALRRLLRETLAVPSGDIRLSDMLRLVELSGNDTGIVDLTGLETATRLKLANLLGNRIEDPSPLGGLTGLEGLNLTLNRLTDISSLAGLTGLRGFGCGQNELTDVAIVTGLTGLETLSIHDNPLTAVPDLASLVELKVVNLGSLGLTDLGAIAGCPHLRVVIANGNRLTDISALGGLADLQEAHLRFNDLTDLAPLVGNAGFGTGDLVDVRDNPLSSVAVTEQIPVLVARGVTVQY